MARAYVDGARAASVPASCANRFVANALAVLDHPDLKPLFGTGSRAEAPIAGRVLTAEGAIMVSGQIDRLAVLESTTCWWPISRRRRGRRTRASRRRAPTWPSSPSTGCCSPRSIRDRRIRTFLVWTSGPVIHELMEPDLEAALTLIKAA